MLNFLPQDLEDLRVNKRIIEAQIAEVSRRDRKSGHVLRSSMGGSDVGDQHSHRHEQELLCRRSQEINDVLRQAQLVEMPTDCTQLRLGHVATIQRYDENENKIGDPETYFVSSYGTTDATAMRLSYDSPILAPLLGKRVDLNKDPLPVRIGGKTIYVELLKIELATTK